MVAVLSKTSQEPEQLDLFEDSSKDAGMELLFDDASAFVKRYGQGESLAKVPMKDPNNRWLVRSALQKYIRRGFSEDAMRMARYLYAFDPKVLYRALATIMVEDVSLGDVDLLTYSTAQNVSLQFRRNVDPSLMVPALIRRACEVPKSRACCELSLWVDRSPYFVQYWNEYSQKTTEQLVIDTMELYLAKDMPAIGIAGAYMAACTLRGMVPRTVKQRRPTDQAGIFKLLEKLVDMMPYKKARAAMLSFERPVDSMSIAAWPVILASLEKPKEVLQQSFPEEVLIKGVTGAAYDMHTHSGKKALKAYYTSLCKTYPDLSKAVPVEHAVGGLGAAVFIEEGGLVDRVITYKSGPLSDLRWRQDHMFMISEGVDPKALDDVRGLVRSTIPRLNEKRQWAVSLGA